MKSSGRPPKPASERYVTPNRSAGRIPDEEWERIKSAAEANGETVTAAIRRVMGQWAKRTVNRKGG